MLNNEQVGISAEIAIADEYCVKVNPQYRTRGVNNIINSITPIVKTIFDTNSISEPIKHIAEKHNETDFMLKDNKTLSVKTNKQSLGKAAPQIIGQASSNTWFTRLSSPLSITTIPTIYSEKVALFKQIILTRTDEILAIYWKNMFDCDYLIHIYNIVDKHDKPTNDPSFIVFKKSDSPKWEKDKITFTKNTVKTWNESSTVKYNGIAIGEFQVHNNRDNFKFRFNMAGIAALLNSDNLKFV